MFILSNFLQAIARILDQLLMIYNWVVLIAVLLTWVNPDPYNPIVRVLRQATEPVFAWVRKHLPFAVLGMMDLSPIIVFLFIWFARMFLVASLYDISLRIR
jgi:YggT family protein